MLYYKIIEGKNGKPMKRYYMTQGDTFQNQLSILDPQGVEISPDLIEELVFKLSDMNYNEQYRQEYIYDPSLNKWAITIDSETTMTWDIDQHIYEYQLTYKGGVVRTPVQERFVVQDQIQGE